MTELEQALLRLGDEIVFPETPAVAPAVRSRLAAKPERRRDEGRRRRTLALAFVLLAVAIGAALAVPSARTAILEFLRLRGATVQRVERLPAVPARVAAELELGRPVPVEDGRPRVKFPVVLVPAVLGEPDAAYVSAAAPGGKLSLVYRPGEGIPRSPYTGVGLLVSQFGGSLEPDLVRKLAPQATSVEQVSVEGRPAIWLEGGPHVVLFRSGTGEVVEDAGRLAGNTLLVEHGGLLVRIEGEVGLDRALAVAASLEPVGQRR